jgi:hypothetical protein
MSDLIGTLAKMGFTQGAVVETILVTVNSDGSFNAAPMGVRLMGRHLGLSPYRTSATYANLMRGGRASINTTLDPLLFLATAFKDEIEDQPHVEPDMRLMGADSTIIVEVKQESSTLGERGLFTATPVKITVGEAYPTVFSRGRNQAVEAVIHATRVKAFSEQGRRGEAEALIRKIDECTATVRRVSPQGSPEHAVVDKLEDMIPSWRVTA